MTKTEWICKRFDDLTAAEMYSILQLRQQVFVIEQQCIYQDCDDRDAISFHNMGMRDGTLIAYSRLIPPGIFYSECSIGRVVNSPLVRGSGVGKELMIQNISKMRELFGVQPVRIGAQLYLQKFYESLGFIQTSEPFLEDNIPHIYMVLMMPEPE